MSLLLLSCCLLSIIFKKSYFQCLVLLEVSLLTTCLGLLMNGVSPWFVLPLLGVGACESATGFSTAVWLSRHTSVSTFTV